MMFHKHTSRVTITRVTGKSLHISVYTCEHQNIMALPPLYHQLFLCGGGGYIPHEIIYLFIYLFNKNFMMNTVNFL